MLFFPFPVLFGFFSFRQAYLSVFFLLVYQCFFSIKLNSIQFNSIQLAVFSISCPNFCRKLASRTTTTTAVQFSSFYPELASEKKAGSYFSSFMQILCIIFFFSISNSSAQLTSASSSRVSQESNFNFNLKKINSSSSFLSRPAAGHLQKSIFFKTTKSSRTHASTQARTHLFFYIPQSVRTMRIAEEHIYKNLPILCN